MNCDDPGGGERIPEEFKARIHNFFTESAARAFWHSLVTTHSPEEMDAKCEVKRVTTEYGDLIQITVID